MNLSKTVVSLFALTLLLAAPAAFAVSDVVISQVYGGGGNSGATYTHDFIELFNRGALPVNISGWSVQYVSATGTGTWSVTPIPGPFTLQPGQYFLIQQAQGAGGTVPLPTPDVIGTIAMSGTAGKVALVNSMIALSGSCPAGRVDLVGYGSTATCSETTPTAGTGNTTAAIRNSNGCADTDNNAIDFTIAAPTPRNSATTFAPCNFSTPPSGVGLAEPSTVFQGSDSFLTVTVTPGDNPPSTGLAVTADLTSIGGSATQTFFDDGATGGDSIPDDNVFSWIATVDPATPPGAKNLPATITDDEGRSGAANIALEVIAPTPVLTIDNVTQAEGNSGTTTFAFTVTLNLPAGAGGVTFDIATADGTASASTDYMAGTLTGQTITAGNNTYTFNVTVNGDTAVESHENFFVNVTNVTGATVGDGQAVGTINNDDIPPTTALIFSEYVEGSGNNKALEIFNTTTSPVDLGATGYRVELYSNGSATVTNSVNLTGILAPNDVLVIVNASADPALLALGDIVSNVTNFNGDDALVLRRGGAGGPIDDSIGQVGFDPGTVWGSGDETTAEHSLRREPYVCVGDTVIGDAYDPGPEYISFPQNTFDGVGTHSSFCGAGPTLLVSNVTQAEGQSGTTIFTFSVFLTQPATRTVTFAIDTANGTAVAGSDYVARSLIGQTIETGALSYDFQVTVNGDATVEANETFFVNVSSIIGANPGDTQGLGTIVNDDTTPVAIHEIQGDGSQSPLVGAVVTTSGIVTGTKFGSSGGFYIQTPLGSEDADPNTSQGIFVFTGATLPAGAVIGNDVTVSGTVVEFRPSSDPFSPPLTELSAPAVVVNSTGNPLPPPAPITAADTNPAGSIEQLERFEGMRVLVASMTVIAPTGGFVNEANATSTSNGVFHGVVSGVARPFREPGIAAPEPPPNPPCCIPQFDNNPERLRVDTDGQQGALPLDVAAGMTVTNVVGPLDFAFRTYTILPDAAMPPLASGSSSFTAVPVPNADEFTIAGYNLERFYNDVDDAGGDAVLTTTAYQNRLNKASLAIRNVLRSPDILGVSEVENLATLQALAAKINTDTVAAGGVNPAYTAHLVEGNDVGLIDVGYLVKTTRVTVNNVTQVGATATYINPNNGQSELIWDRPPLVLEATIVQPGLALTVIANHLRSLNGVSDPAEGNRVRHKRRAGAEWLAGYVQSRQTAAPSERIVLVGDFNAFEFNDGLVDVMGTIAGQPTPADQVLLASADVVNPNLNNLINTVAAGQKYSFTFDGNAQALDHILTNDDAQSHWSRMAYGRSGADFPETHRNDPARPERLSDHDGAVAYFTFLQGGIHFDVTVPATVVQGTSFSGTVTARDAANNVLTTYNGTVHFTSSDPNALLPADYTFTVGDAGTHTFTNGFGLVAAGAQSITATDTLNSAITGTGNTTVTCPEVTVAATNNGPMCEGGTLLLDVTEVPGATYAWTGPNGFTADTRNPGRTNVTVADAGTYSVTITRNGCVYAASTEVTINATPPAPAITPSGIVQICEGASVTLTSSSSTGNQWYIGGTPIAGATGQTHVTSTEGVYTVTVTNGTCTSAPSQFVRVVVSPAPITPVISAPASVVIGGSSSAIVTNSNFDSTYAWTITGGAITGGQGSPNIEFSAGPAGTRMTLSVVETNTSGCSSAAGTRYVVVDFNDVPPSHPFHAFVISIARAGITTGCGGGNYCVNDPVLRSQMAVFLLRGIHGESYAPPEATGIFADVPVPDFFANFIERLYAEGITGGCAADPLRYCPNNPVLRSQMAIFLLRAKHGSSYTPPAATGIFADVPIGSFAADWIEQLYEEGITSGCADNPLRFCPNDSATRGAMAVFLTRTFNLP